MLFLLDGDERSSYCGKSESEVLNFGLPPIKGNDICLSFKAKAGSNRASSVSEALRLNYRCGLSRFSAFMRSLHMTLKYS